MPAAGFSLSGGEDAAREALFETVTASGPPETFLRLAAESAEAAAMGRLRPAGVRAPKQSRGCALSADKFFDQAGKLAGVRRRMLHLFHLVGAETVSAADERNLIIRRGLPVQQGIADHYRFFRSRFP